MNKRYFILSFFFKARVSPNPMASPSWPSMIKGWMVSSNPDESATNLMKNAIHPFKSLVALVFEPAPRSTCCWLPYPTTRVFAFEGFGALAASGVFCVIKGWGDLYRLDSNRSGKVLHATIGDSASVRISHISRQHRQSHGESIVNTVPVKPQKCLGSPATYEILGSRTSSCAGRFRRESRRPRPGAKIECDRPGGTLTNSAFGVVQPLYRLLEQ
jgi:hypothetical protein